MIFHRQRKSACSKYTACPIIPVCALCIHVLHLGNTYKLHTPKISSYWGYKYAHWCLIRKQQYMLQKKLTYSLSRKSKKDFWSNAVASSKSQSAPTADNYILKLKGHRYPYAHFPLIEILCCLQVSQPRLWSR